MSAAKIHLDHAHVLHLLREMLRIRVFERKCAELYQRERIRGFLHLYDGEEAIAVGVMQALAAQDAVVATYREHGQALARGVPMERILAEMYGCVEGSACAAGAAVRCTCSTVNDASSVGMPSLAVGCRSRSVPHSVTACRAGTRFRSASSAKARSTKVSFTRA